MFKTPDGHAVFRNPDHPHNVYCQATMKVAYDKEEGNHNRPAPLGFMPYPEKWQKTVFENPDKIRAKVTERAIAIVARANETKMTDDGVSKMIEVENERIFTELKEAAVKKFTSATAARKPGKNRPSAMRRRVVEKPSSKSGKKPKPRMRATG